MTVEEAFAEHLHWLETQALTGDVRSIKSLAAMALLTEWSPPDGRPYNPEDAPDVIDLAQWRARLAA